MTYADEYWFNFLKETNRDEQTVCSGDINFESKGFVNDSQVSLILGGEKTAIFSTLASYAIDNEVLPVSGELYMVFDRDNNPRAVIEIQSVNIVPFNEVTWEMAKKEGEDNNLEEWKSKQTEYLKEEADILGFDFCNDLKLVFQTFNVVYK